MKKIYIPFFAILGFVALSCSAQKNDNDDKKSEQEKYEEKEVDKPDRPIGETDYEINPETREVTFRSKGDTVIVKTENLFWFIYGHETLYEGQNQSEQITYRPNNFDRDTLISPWVKVIALDNEKDLSRDGTHMYIESKTLKIIAFENSIPEDRKFNILLTCGNASDDIYITQEGK